MADSNETIQDILTEISNNLYDVNLKWYTTQDVMNAIQDAYNKIVALLKPIEHSSLIPKLAEPYYDFRQISDFMYVSGIFNPTTNLWLEGLSYKQMKATYQTYLAIGEPKWINIVDLYRAIIWPYPPGATGVLYIIYKAQAPQITSNHIPILPHSIGPRLLEYFATADLLEQAREFKKAQIWWDRALKPNLILGIASIFDQCKKEIQSIARADRENVLEPYRWIFHGGQFSDTMWIDDEIPAGTQDGVNDTFTITKIPNPTNSLLLFRNGVKLTTGNDFTLTGRTIVFAAGQIPQVAGTPGDSDDVIRAWYQIS